MCSIETVVFEKKKNIKKYIKSAKVNTVLAGYVASYQAERLKLCMRSLPSIADTARVSFASKAH